MKRKLIPVLALVCMMIASLMTATVAFAATAVPEDYTVSSGCVVNSQSAGGVISVSNIKHAQLVQMNIGAQLDAAADKYINLKGKASTDAYRIKMNYRMEGASSSTEWISRLYDTTAASSGKVTVDANGYFEAHLELDAGMYNGTLEYVSFQIYVTGKDANNGIVASVEFLGVAFDADVTYSNFAESNGSVVEPEPPQEPEQPEQPTGELALGDIVAPAPATVSKNAAGEQTVTYSASAGWSTYDIAVTNYDAKYIYFVAEFTPSADTAICFAINGEIDWAIGHKVYVGGEKATETFMVSEYNLPANFTVSMYIDAEAEVTAEKSVVFHSIAFKAPESNEMAFGDIVAPAPATATKNAEGEQVVTYSASAGWDTYTVAVTNYDSKNTVFEAVFTASAEVTICFEINGKIDWSLGHKLYPAGSENKQLIDVSTYELPKNFTIGMYIDAEAEVTAEKSIVFHSIAFTEPAPEPEGMYFVEPIASAMQCVANANGGYDLTWTHNGVDYSAVNVGVKNFDVTYDILVVRMNASAGQSIGIYLTYMKEVDGEVVPVDMAVRTHWSTESVITKDGEQEFVFFMERFGIKGAVISAVKLYFDAPTGAYTPLEGE